jgi:hypothetical protein
VRCGEGLAPEVELVALRCGEAQDQVAPAVRAELVGVSADASGEGIVPDAPYEQIVILSAEQQVVVLPAVQGVVARLP